MKQRAAPNGANLADAPKDGGLSECSEPPCSKVAPVAQSRAKETFVVLSPSGRRAEICASTAAAACRIARRRQPEVGTWHIIHDDSRWDDVVSEIEALADTIRNGGNVE